MKLRVVILGAAWLQLAAWDAVVTTRAAEPAKPGSVAALIAELRSADPERTVRAAQSLLALGEDAATAVPALIAALEDRRPIRWPPGTPAIPVRPPQIPDRASDALAAIGAAAVDPLLQALDRALGGEEPNEDLAIVVLRALRNMGDKAAPALPRIKRLITDAKTERTGVWALDSYAEIQPVGPEYVAFATGLLGAYNPLIRSRAAQMLGKAGGAATSAVEPLVAMLEDQALVDVQVAPDMAFERPLRYDAIVALGQIGPAAASAAGSLRKVIAGDEDVDIRVAAALALVRIEGPDSVAMDFLIATLGDGQENIMGMSQAADALEQIGPDAIAALDALSACLKHENEYSRISAIEALAAVGGKLAVPEIAVVAADTKEDDTVREVAIEALERIGGPAAMAAIEAVLNDKDEGVRYYAEHALARMRGEPIED